MQAAFAISVSIAAPPIFKSVSLGKYRSASEYRTALNEAKSRIGRLANEMLDSDQFEWTGCVITVELLRISVAELGFSGDTRLWEIYARGLELGLDLCPPEVGPALRCAKIQQRRGEWLDIAMKPIADFEGYPHIFVVGCDSFGERHLDDAYGYPDDSWLADSQFVFRRAKP